MKRRLITSALPYVNNIPHLGNLVQTLSADVFARFCRLKGYDTLYICGTDEYGTATETRARELGISPRELCDRFYAVHAESYEWFQLSFDRFGRTSHPQHTTITQGLFQALHTHGYIKRKKIEQLYSEELTMFLADRYVRGQCPHCDYAEARGDQCEHCGNLLDPLDLIDPRCILDGSVPVKRPTEHLYIDLPKLRHRLEEWLQQSKAQTRWAKNALAMTRAWIRDGLRERAITRDLKWGIPVPLDGFRDKVFYVWFDAPIGYISITAAHTDRWREWWHNPDEVELTQFVGKDNIPFHAVVFPCTLLGSGERWTMLHNISSTEYLNYEGGQFSKSSGRGVFATDAMDSGIPSDVWRYYLIATRPETADSSFTWEEFYNRVNKEVIGVFANFFNRITAFVIKNYAGIVPSADGVASADSVASADDEGPDAKIDAFNAEDECFAPMEACIARIDSALERAELRSALRGVIDLAGLGNKLFQDHEPWKQIANAPRKVAQLLAALFVLAKNLTILISPFLPHTAQSCRAILGINQHLRWADMRTSVKHATLEPRALLFKRLQWKDIEMLQKKYSGTEKGAATQASPSASTATADNRRPPAAPADQHPPAAPADQHPPAAPADRQHFIDEVELRVARIIEVVPHPNADTLYIETLDDGTATPRRIVSGLAPYYTVDELANRTIIIVANLKPIKLRGVQSSGMLLAATHDKKLEILECDAAPGALLTCGTDCDPPQSWPSLDINRFHQFPLRVHDYTARFENTPLTADDAPITTSIIAAGTIE